MDTRKFKKGNKTSDTSGTLPPEGFITSNVTPALDPNNQEKSTTVETPAVGEEPADVIETYVSYLKENGIDKVDILSTLDSIITDGDVYWGFTLFNKIPVTFKMRPSWVNQELLTVIDANPPASFAKFSDVVGTYNLAGSLVRYGDNSLEATTPEELQANIKWVSALPYIIQEKLVKKMAVFDRLVAVATSDWAVENFTEHQSEG